MAWLIGSGNRSHDSATMAKSGSRGRTCVVIWVVTGGREHPVVVRLGARRWGCLLGCGLTGKGLNRRGDFARRRFGSLDVGSTGGGTRTHDLRIIDPQPREITKEARSGPSSFGLWWLRRVMKGRDLSLAPSRSADSAARQGLTARAPA